MKVKASVIYSIITIIPLPSTKTNRNIFSFLWPTSSYRKVFLLTYPTLHFLEEPVLPRVDRHTIIFRKRFSTNLLSVWMTDCPRSPSSKRISGEQECVWGWLLGMTRNRRSAAHPNTGLQKFIYHSMENWMLKRTGIKAWFIHCITTKNTIATKILDYLALVCGNSITSLLQNKRTSKSLLTW